MQTSKAGGEPAHRRFSSIGLRPINALALALNANNRVVGYGNSSSGSKAFIYPEAAHNVIALDGLLSAADQAQWQLITAEGVNDNRQVTGWGYHNGVARAYLLTPLP